MTLGEQTMRYGFAHAANDHGLFNVWLAIGIGRQPIRAQPGISVLCGVCYGAISFCDPAEISRSDRR